MLTPGQFLGTNLPDYTMFQHSTGGAERTVGPKGVLRIKLRDNSAMNGPYLITQVPDAWMMVRNLGSYQIPQKHGI